MANVETIAAKRTAVAVVTASLVDDLDTAEKIVDELTFDDRKRVIAILAGMLEAMLWIVHDDDLAAIRRSLQSYALGEGD